MYLDIWMEARDDRIVVCSAATSVTRQRRPRGGGVPWETGQEVQGMDGCIFVRCAMHRPSPPMPTPSLPELPFTPSLHSGCCPRSRQLLQVQQLLQAPADMLDAVGDPLLLVDDIADDGAAGRILLGGLHSRDWGADAGVVEGLGFDQRRAGGFIGWRYGAPDEVVRGSGNASFRGRGARGGSVTQTGRGVGHHHGRGSASATHDGPVSHVEAIRCTVVLR